MEIGDFLKRQPITILIDTGSTNNFMDNKVVAQMMLQIEGCSKFDVKVANGRVLKYVRKCPRKTWERCDDGFDAAYGESPTKNTKWLGVRRELAESIGRLLGWRKGVRQKRTKTRRKIIKGSRKACQEYFGRLTRLGPT
ncbi:hypothetical protein BHM03_00038471, partial [Ensete ventricosum]